MGMLRQAWHGRIRRVVGGVAATMVVAAAVVDAPDPATAAAAQAGGPHITATPAQDLTDGDLVHVDATGLVVDKRYGLFQCKAGATGLCDFTEAVGAVAEWDGDGSVGGVIRQLPFRADTFLTTGQEAQETTDCRVEGACVVALVADAGIVATAALHFDPAAEPAPPPSITVTPQDGLVHGQEVTVQADGFVWGGDIAVFQCVRGALARDSCDTDADHLIPTGEQDSVAGGIAVSTAIYTATHGAVDCREEAACSLVASMRGLMNPSQTATAELAFDSSAPLPEPPSVVVRPNADLVDGQVVELRGRNFAPSRYVSFYQCWAEPHWTNCRQVAVILAYSDGGFTTSARVWAMLDTPFGERDCRATDGACVLVATEAYGNPASRRAVRIPLVFDRDGPLLPTPKLTVSPTEGLIGGGIVSIEGADWTPGPITVQTCAASSPPDEHCDAMTTHWILEGEVHNGSFAIEHRVADVFVSGLTGEPVNCRIAPGCAIVAVDEGSGRAVSVPIIFEGTGPARRYFDPVFEKLDVAYNVVYRDTVDAQGRPIQLKMDIYQPAGDSAAQRPAIVWMHGGNFGVGDKDNTAGYARQVARRGYVGISLQYRLRPEIGCCAMPSAELFTSVAHDAYDDAVAGVDWLKEHAADYRIDPRAIVAGGFSAGGVTAFNLAYLPGQRGPATSNIAAAIPVGGGGSLGTPEPGEPPILTFHSTHDFTVPYSQVEATCSRAREANLRCDLVTYDERLDLFTVKRHEIMRRSMDFLAETVLAPLGYFDPGAPGPATTTATTTSAGGGSGGDSSTAAAAASSLGADLPRTGADIFGLVRIGIVLSASGTTAALLARRRLSRR